jgi:acetyl-CoA carboxylase biotin carboxyl carrier protein
MAKKTATKKASTKKAAKTTAKPSAKKTAKAAARTTPKAPTALAVEVEYLMAMMVANDVTEVDVADGKRHIALKRGTYTPYTALAAPVATPAPAMGALAQMPPAIPAEAPAEPKEKLLEIKSPMVGTFYAAASPDSAAYVTVGDNIGDETVVCIVEAMKVMNEIKAECSGKIAEICVKNAEPVEFGQVLFRVKP